MDLHSDCWGNSVYEIGWWDNKETLPLPLLLQSATSNTPIKKHYCWLRVKGSAAGADLTQPFINTPPPCPEVNRMSSVWREKIWPKSYSDPEYTQNKKLKMNMNIVKGEQYTHARAHARTHESCDYMKYQQEVDLSWVSLWQHRLFLISVGAAET